MSRARVLVQVIFSFGASVLLICTPASAQGPCVNIFDDPGTQCFGSDCFLLCAAGPSLAEPSDPLFPGFFGEVSARGFVVTAVLPNTPAEEAGLKRGDELVAVDGVRLPLLGTQPSLWEEAGLHTLTVIRAGKRHSIAFQSLRISELLARWISSAGDLSPASAASDSYPNVSLKPYLSGVSVRFDRGVAQVVSVFAGSEASRAGVLPGDIVVAVNGEEPRIDFVQGFAVLEGGHSAASRNVLLQRGESLLRTHFALTALTRLLRNAPGGVGQPEALKAGL